MLNSSQSAALNAVVSGHNVFICGQAGTGKSFLVRNIVETVSQSKHVTLLCTTGMGCLQYSSQHRAMTVHSWAVLYDGRYDSLTLKNLVTEDEKYQTVRQNVSATELIIIDEVYMLSMKVFEQLELVCRDGRGVDNIFGGVQLVLCGDFYQLPPVGNSLYNDSGKFCFESVIFQNYIKYRINLSHVMRHDEPMLIRTVRETALGSVSDEVDQFLKSFDKPLPQESECVHLFPKNIDAAIFNSECLAKMNTEGMVYKAVRNEGHARYLQKILGPHYLHLKISAPIVLLSNLGGKLVNGLPGIVTKLEADAMCVHFKSINETHTIKRLLFTKYNVAQKRNMASRQQFPLMLSFALIIHKSQGMTLSNVCIHCKGIFQAGQLSVAIGRAVSSSGIVLHDYRKGLCYQPKSAISIFYGETSDTGSCSSDDLSCCKKFRIQQDIPDCVVDYESDTSEFDTSDVNFLDHVHESCELDLPTYIDVAALKLHSFTNTPVTEKQKKINQICMNIDIAKLKKFAFQQHERVKVLVSGEMASTKTAPSEWTLILSKNHLYMTGDDYLSAVKALFSLSTVSNEHVTVASDVVMNIVKFEVAHVAATVTTTHSHSQFQPGLGKMSEAGMAKIR